MDKKKNNSVQTSCSQCPLCATTEWDVLDAHELEILEKAKRSEHFEAGETLFFQGEEGCGIYCIRSGLIGLRRVDSNGNSVLLHLVEAGTTVGYRTFVTRDAHSHSAEVLTPSKVCYFVRPQIERVMQINPVLGEKFLQHFTRDATETENSYVKSMTMGMKSRFLHLMLEFYERYGHTDDQGDPVLDLPVKRGELAELVGVRPESISRLIDKLQSDNVMHFEQRRVRFTDLARVRAEVGAKV